MTCGEHNWSLAFRWRRRLSVTPVKLLVDDAVFARDFLLAYRVVQSSIELSWRLRERARRSPAAASTSASSTTTMVRDSRGKATRAAGHRRHGAQSRSTHRACRALYLDCLEHSFHAARSFVSVRAALHRPRFVSRTRSTTPATSSWPSRVGPRAACGWSTPWCCLVVTSSWCCSTRAASLMVRRAWRTGSRVGRPFVIAHRELFTGASIGIAPRVPSTRRRASCSADADTATANRVKAEGAAAS